LKKANVVTSAATDGLQLIAGAESFLVGGYERHLRDNDQIIPGWTRLNCLAHGNLNTLKRMAKAVNTRMLPALTERNSELAWTVAQSAIAGELVALTLGSTKLLERIQSRVLIEFCLMDEDNVTALEVLIVTREALQSELG
jgi:hypothetical protein